MKQLIIIFLFFPLLSFSQDFGEYIKKNAIEIKSINELSLNIYNSISKYELITIGEMHGTQEPAKFVESLSNLILKKEDKVSIGLEIPRNELTLFIKNPTRENLLKTEFFSKENIDGRNGTAWFNLILNCANDTNVNLFYFDNHQEYEDVKRDSIMYTGIKEQKIKFPNAKIITLTGNIHNWRVPFNDMTTMGMYCLKDTITFSTNKICSMNHIYSEGTMLNNAGNGLELKTINFEENVFTTSIDFKNYLILYDFGGSENNNNCTLYTSKVNQSERIISR